MEKGKNTPRSSLSLTVQSVPDINSFYISFCAFFSSFSLLSHSVRFIHVSVLAALCVRIIVSMCLFVFVCLCRSCSPSIDECLCLRVCLCVCVRVFNVCIRWGTEPALTHRAYYYDYYCSVLKFCTVLLFFKLKRDTHNTCVCIQTHKHNHSRDGGKYENILMLFFLYAVCERTNEWVNGRASEWTYSLWVVHLDVNISI